MSGIRNVPLVMSSFVFVNHHSTCNDTNVLICPKINVSGIRKVPLVMSSFVFVNHHSTCSDTNVWLLSLVM